MSDLIRFCKLNWDNLFMFPLPTIILGTVFFGWVGLYISVLCTYGLMSFAIVEEWQRFKEAKTE